MVQSRDCGSLRSWLEEWFQEDCTEMGLPKVSLVAVIGLSHTLLKMVYFHSYEPHEGKILRKR